MGLNEWQVKGVKNTIGMEGYGAIGNLYRNYKKVGEFADYGDGGMVNFHFINKKEEEDFIEAEKPFRDSEIMKGEFALSILLSAFDIEKQLNKAMKKNTLIIDNACGDGEWKSYDLNLKNLLLEGKIKGLNATSMEGKTCINLLNYNEFHALAVKWAGASYLKDRAEFEKTIKEAV